MPLLKKAGVSDEGIETVRTAMPHLTGNPGEKGLDERLWAAMAYTDAMTKDVRVPNAVFDKIKGMLDDRQVVELSKAELFINYMPYMPLLIFYLQL